MPRSWQTEFVNLIKLHKSLLNRKKINPQEQDLWSWVLSLAKSGGRKGICVIPFFIQNNSVVFGSERCVLCVLWPQNSLWGVTLLFRMQVWDITEPMMFLNYQYTINKLVNRLINLLHIMRNHSSVMLNTVVIACSYWVVSHFCL